MESGKIVASIQEGIIGGYGKLSGPFGDKPICYIDWIASGRCLSSIEKHLQTEVLPYYGNTHTTTSLTGHQTACYRDEAKQIVAESVNARVSGKFAHDVVLFCGNGTTAAINRMVLALGLFTPLPEVFFKLFKCVFVKLFSRVIPKMIVP